MSYEIKPCTSKEDEFSTYMSEVSSEVLYSIWI